ncbi:unnamed protein product [Caenorhabditis bovis]|uniref:Uncharacterized protein n=1 Tax=Caenorhabditis bovis TaxID=2654633 RepID=A0A8S1FAJ8_9PELO|nr:unnamed protein product [Caenorhabditis bovis]
MPDPPTPYQITHEQISEAERFIQQVKVSDLTKILERAGLRKNGLKTELQSRFTAALRCPQTQWKTYQSLEYFRKGLARPSPYQIPTRNFQMFGHNGIRVPYAGGSTMHAAQQFLSGPVSTVRSSPKLVIQNLPFYDVCSTILEPMELPAHPTTTKANTKIAFNFVLGSEIEASIHRFDSRPLPRYEIQLRFFNATELDEPQKDDFPLNCNVRVDDTCIPLPNVIPTNKANAEPKRPSRPVCITASCVRRTGPHRLHVEWTADRRTWAVAIYYVHRLSSSILYERIARDENRRRKSELTKQEIVKKLSGADDDGIAMDRIKIGLLCPLSKTRMTTPARCTECTHLQSFDLNSYLMMNEKRPVWSCPVCATNAPYEKLYIDEYFCDVLKNVAPDVKEVELKEDGCYRVMAEEEAILLSDDDDDDGDDDIKVTRVPPPSKPISKKPPLEVVLDDSDDERVSIGIRNSLNQADDEPAVNNNNAGPAPRANGHRSPRVLDVITLDDTPPRPAMPLRRGQPSSSSSSAEAVSSSIVSSTSQEKPATIQDALANMCETAAQNSSKNIFSNTFGWSSTDSNLVSRSLSANGIPYSFAGLPGNNATHQQQASMSAAMHQMASGNAANWISRGYQQLHHQQQQLQQQAQFMGFSPFRGQNGSS